MKEREMAKYGIIDYLPYNKPLINSINVFSEQSSSCPHFFPNNFNDPLTFSLQPKQKVFPYKLFP